MPGFRPLTKHLIKVRISGLSIIRIENVFKAQNGVHNEAQGTIVGWDIAAFLCAADRELLL